MQDDLLLLPKRVQLHGSVEICRSFSYKLNTGQYESRDFFCSQKATCGAEDAEATSNLVYEFCKREVLRSVREYLAELNDQRSKPAAVAASGRR